MDGTQIAIIAGSAVGVLGLIGLGLWLSFREGRRRGTSDIIAQMNSMRDELRNLISERVKATDEKFEKILESVPDSWPIGGRVKLRPKDEG